ncbi:MAG: high potential iron sulfur protein [Rhodomicrobium sp.]
MDHEGRQQPKVSRRAMIRGAIVTASAVPVLLAGINSAYAAKISQKAVGYQDTPKGTQSCENCRLFEPPSGCKSVDGTISPNAWCRIYVKK